MFHTIRDSDFRWIILVLALIGGIVLFLFDPTQSSLFPKCPFLVLTGYQCPGCGAQRAVHALLHGDLRTAWAMHPLLVVSIPYILLGLYSDRKRETETGQWLRKYLYGREAIGITLAVVIGYTVLRNI